MDYLQKLGENLRRRILDSSGSGSIELFAHENQIPKSTLSEVLNGKNDPRLSTLAKICSGLDIRLSDLFADPGLEHLVAESAGKYQARGSSKRTASRSPAPSPRSPAKAAREKPGPARGK
jgi:transcriptional regulator with XRE-family HTH domain